ncbi:DUF5753 domain-containing protein [Embleya sp. AB8]|uniref:DUF5753 domain-containing protein n=1 Tax=Embleya sp. AB8 TaxID=3156304 RepID=UPI003C795FFB
MPSSVVGFAELLGRCERTAVHLELRDSYAPTDRFEAWHRGERIDWENRESWWHPQWKQLQRTGLRRLQESVGDLYQQTSVFRVYVSDVIPGFLQTAGYATALLSTIANLRGTPDDVGDAVAVRMRRNAVLNNGMHRFAFVLEESVLRHRLCGAETMAAQLGHLLGVMDLQNVAVGIIPFSAQRNVWPMSTFTIFDDTRVHTDTLDAAATLMQPSQIELYARAFERQSKAAVRGASARSLIAAALAALD